ncbi:glycogen synthase GlgA [Pseudoroseicyclus aestuarii]|uniref:Glycogen synthase n=1 Tax=Pseudoroseicyclus aestuarii TaxID=1795041 RepID=A0A318T065_9RHOB|nr:glycogen synthase GlgA [Pseudoroseicyclus aestuarii]PYE86009.1 starch synthase [Pseudoroseicyclus aestuarii]
MTDVLSVASECAPLIKTGGLADVVGALPSALMQEGLRMRVLIPGYPAVMAQLSETRSVLEDPDLFGGAARVLAAEAADLDLLVLDAPHLYDRPGGPYIDESGADWPDNPERFAALSWIAARIGLEGVTDAQAEGGTWRPEVLQCHDWQAALAPEYVHAMGGTGKVGTIVTIHNIAFQGLAEASRLSALRLPPERFTPDGFEFWGRISALKAGLTSADRLTTVSPTYAAELMRDDYGGGLDGLLRSRRDHLSGILNGIDETVWNPATDEHINRTYRSARGKAPNTAALRGAMGLPEAEGPLCVCVTRLTEQKGIDLLIEALPRLLRRGGQLALLGSGEARFEDALREMAEREPNLAVQIGYDEVLAHRLIAGGDAILVPSRFEPCGLTQLYALRYGTVPLVAMTGGLADTVINANAAALDRGVATGVQFHPVIAETFGVAIDQLCDLYARSDLWGQLQRNAMRQPVGWGPSAQAYAALFREVAPAA